MHRAKAHQRAAVFIRGVDVIICISKIDRIKSMCARQRIKDEVLEGGWKEIK